MDDALLAAVAKYAPAWVRYVLTLSEIAATGEGWVLAVGDDITIMNAGGTSAMPLWPYRNLADQVSGTDEDGNVVEGRARPLALAAAELAEKTLPALAKNEVSVAVFPGPAENRLIGATAVANDLAELIAQPRDISAELAVEPHTIQLEHWTKLGVPDMGNVDADDDARLWLLVSGEESVIGVVIGEEPALALFADRETAADFAREAGVEATPRPASVGSLIGHWLLMAYSAGWDTAIIAEDGEAGLVKPVRLALDLGRVRATEGT